MLTVESGAAQKIKTLITSEQEKGKFEKEKEYGLRVGVKGGGCSGYTYVMDFDTQKENDKIFEHEGVKVFVDPKSMMFLHGSVISYKDSLTGAGFEIKNPNVKSSCGCGTSFSTQ